MGKSILDTVHEEAKGLCELDLIDEQTMHEFDKLCRENTEPKDAPHAQEDLKTKR